MEKRTLEQAKELVNSSFPTIFSKEDVTKLLESIEIPEPEAVSVPVLEGKFALTEEQIESLSEKIAMRLEDSDMVNLDNIDYDVSVNYDKRIEIDIDSSSVEIDTYEIERVASRVITEFIEKLNEESSENEERYPQGE